MSEPFWENNRTAGKLDGTKGSGNLEPAKHRNRFKIPALAIKKERPAPKGMARCVERTRPVALCKLIKMDQYASFI